MKKVLLTLSLSCFVLIINAQNVSGNWQGILTHPNDTVGFVDNFPFWLNIEQEGDSIKGHSRVELGTTKDFSVMNFEGTFRNNHIDLVEVSWEESHMGKGVFINWCLKRASLIYTFEDSTESLKGVWSASAECGPGEIIVYRTAKEFSKTNAQNHDYISFSQFRSMLTKEESVLNKKVILPSVTFEAYKSHLIPEAREILKELKDVMQEYPKLRINILGHTGNLGHDQYNLTLSLERARTVKDYLAKMGVSESRLHFHGFGESRPVESNASEDGRRANRRIEFEILSE